MRDHAVMPLICLTCQAIFCKTENADAGNHMATVHGLLSTVLFGGGNWSDFAARRSRESVAPCSTADAFTHFACRQATVRRNKVRKTRSGNSRNSMADQEYELFAIR